MSSLSRASVGLTIITFCLLVFGAAVRVNGAGLACPDWPLCFGQVIPEIDFGVFWEFGHRVLAGLVSIGFLGVWAAVYKHRAFYGQKLVYLGLLAAVVLATQIVLGGLTVLELLAEWTVASHLITGNTFCLSLMLIALWIYETEQPVRREAVSTTGRLFAVLLAVAVPAQLLLGGFVSGSYAGLACGTWPTCDGVSYFPAFSGVLGLQINHRILAYFLLFLASANLLVQWNSPRARRSAGLLLGLVFVQASLGIANVLLHLPPEVTLLHTAGAASCYLAMGWLNWEVWSAPVVSVSSSAAVSVEVK